MIRYRPIAVLTCVLAGVACGSATDATPGDEVVQQDLLLTIQASATSSVVSATIEVTGPGIDPPIVAQLAVVNGAISGTVTVPTGSSRTFTLRTFDANGVELHRGSVIANVTESMAATVSLTLEALVGDVSIDVTIGSITVEIAPTDASIAVGETLNFTATVLDVLGNTISDPVLVWASSNPSLISVDGSGTATAHLPGDVLIVVSCEGIAAVATLGAQ
jgi:uncharacterized protein YjdB